jgi:hypothetical protein
MSENSEIPGSTRRSKQQERFFFIHIQKTAGTSLRQHLLANFDASEVYPPRVEGKIWAYLTYYLHGNLLTELTAERQSLYRLFHGHMPFAVTQRLSLEKTPTTFTILREPVARTLSVLGQKKRHRPEYADASFEEIYSDPSIFEGQILNHQAKIFAVPENTNLLSGYDPYPVGTLELETAKKNLAKVDVIGLQSDMPSFLTELERSFGWKLLESSAWKNVGEKVEVSQSLIDRITADNEIDIEFYRYAVDLVGTRELECGSNRT